MLSGLIGSGQSNAELIDAGFADYSTVAHKWVGGTNLENDWDPLDPGAQWTAMLTAWSNAATPQPKPSAVNALWWVQGEADAEVEAMANAYGANLEEFYDEFKSQFPIGGGFLMVVALLPSWQTQTYNSTVRSAQEAFVSAHGDVVSVSGDNLSPSGVKVDGLHYNATGAAAMSAAIETAIATRSNQVASL